MIPALISLITGLGVPAQLVKPLLAVIGALLILGVLWGGKCAYDHHVIAAHDAKQAAATANADKAADDHAGDQRVIDATREQNEATQAQEAINEAKRNGADPRRAYYDCVRKQQSARRAGQPSPDC